jgi:hypothetical protein
MTDQAMSARRRRMIEDMSIRKFSRRAATLRISQSVGLPRPRKRQTGLLVLTFVVVNFLMVVFSNILTPSIADAKKFENQQRIAFGI